MRPALFPIHRVLFVVDCSYNYIAEVRGQIYHYIAVLWGTCIAI